ncbi:DUF2935 domain-containing protein [Bacillus sp. CGMCC 1.16607]|uniref:DUF2935 domain-containing protein n=1 Tax=Bacillus sp. CGMCC 1.16607 TaxID=3351842 RepID=UPI00364474FA
MANQYEGTALFENGFWLQILGDHARFIHDSLAANEEDSIEKATYFINVFDELLQNVKNINPIELSQLAEREVLLLKEFKLNLLERSLIGKIKIHLPPTFINHMINELEEYQRILNYLKAGKVPPMIHELHHHLIWLVDAAGHAGAINDNLDNVEKVLKKTTHEFTKTFEDFYLKAVELTGYLRTNLASFPALKKFNSDVYLEMKLFKGFLHEIEEMGLTKEMLGTFAPLMADHMAREECYYLTKLSEATELPQPDCDPTKPRLKES